MRRTYGKKSLLESASGAWTAPLSFGVLLWFYINPQLSLANPSKFGTVYTQLKN